MVHTIASARSFTQDVQYKWHRFWNRPDFYVMRMLGRLNTARSAASLFFERSDSCLGHDTLFPGLDAGNVVSALRNDGLYVGIDLPSDCVTDILAYAASSLCYAKGDPALGFPPQKKNEAAIALGAPFAIGNYFNNVLNCPTIRRLSVDSTLLGIAAEYLGAQPVFLGAHLWWSYAAEVSVEEQHRFAQAFHYDIDDYAFLKFFFYLVSVDHSVGPHIYVLGSHRRKKLSHRFASRRFNDAEIIRYYGSKNVVVIEGAPGAGFAEDTFGFHKGLPPKSKDRLVLQFEYALRDYGLHSDVRDHVALKRFV